MMMAMLVILLVVVCFLLILWIFGRSVHKGSSLSEVALHKEQSLDDGYIGVPVDLSKCVGKRGVAITVLRPAGKVKIDDAEFDAISIREFINEGEPVVVSKYENTQLYVERG